jgi:uncharacterized protein
MIEVTVEDIAVSGDDAARFLVLLKAPGGDLLPIVVDALQALAIAAGRQEERPARPLTHDLMLSALELLGASLQKVEITDLVEGTYYAMLVLERQGMRYDVDARPSDALALAVRAKCPVFVAEHVLEANGLSDDVGGSGFEA